MAEPANLDQPTAAPDPDQRPQPAAPPAPQPQPQRGEFSRRALLSGGGLVVGALGAFGISALGAPHDGARGGTHGAVPSTTPNTAPPSGSAAVPAAGTTQAGVARPVIPQRHCLIAVADLDVPRLEPSLLTLGRTIAKLTDPHRTPDGVLPDGPRDLTITVGLGARALAATGAPETAGTVALPQFRGDSALAADRLGGDVLLSVNSADVSVLDAVLTTLTACIAGYHERWTELGTRAASNDDVTRNPLGYHDGIINPRSSEELEENVWITDGALTGGTICVIRRFALHAGEFRALSQKNRDAVIGRSQATGAPLSGGARGDEVALTAKTDSGELLIPPRAHARAAHPSFTGSDLMLRRSYGYRASATDQGLLFVSYQRDIDTFTRTQLRLDDGDDLMSFATPTATAAFAILPGIGASDALGATLFSV